MPIRIEVRNRQATSTRAFVQAAHALGVSSLTACSIVHVYNLASDLEDEEVERICRRLLADPVVHKVRWSRLASTTPANEDSPSPNRASSNKALVEVAYRPGVTDTQARELERGIRELGLGECQSTTAICYELQGTLTHSEIHLLARQLFCNETIQHYALAPIVPAFGLAAQANDRVEQVPLRWLDGDTLMQMSRDRLLSLDLNEMRAIQDFYVELERDPTDVELETLAQTWSEHCVHKTFKAEIEFALHDENKNAVHRQKIDGLLRSYIRAATEAVGPTWLRSAFVDNAGIIAFDDEFDLAFKVETHNHPSALEPFGGANTGIGGVVRDVIGVSARPIATTDVLCFGPQDYPRADVPEGLLHPARIADGVIAGIADYGNKLGLPTANGAVLYDAGYLGNPLVYCGCVGLLPTGRHPTQPQAGDRIVVLGGRTGRDGLHGATFSSAELSQDIVETTGSAVQIGDPITEKAVIELVEALRDEQLYTAITDCGAGGLSSAVGEMGANLGADVELSQVKLKYPGLTPWEIWLSEAQERMVIAVPAANMGRLHELALLWEVEYSDLGAFTGDGDLRVRYNGKLVADLPMHFLHDGLPRRRLQAHWQAMPPEILPPTVYKESPPQILLKMLSHPNVASKEAIVRQYDHEVRGGTIVRPFSGPKMDSPNDAAVLKPLGTWHHNQGFALSVGINPYIGRIDPYAMAVSAVDEAFRNLVAVGADPTRVALLDNFCWGNPTLPDRLGSLVRACQGCYDAAIAYNAPFISGKDSLYNEFEGRPIPGTLLISAISLVHDIHKCITAHLKLAGNLLYLLGETGRELGGSLLHQIAELDGGVPPATPSGALSRYVKLHAAIQNGWVKACHDLSEGGLAVAVAEMALGGRLGVDGSIQTGELTHHEFLFSESNGRLLIEVEPQDAEAVEMHFLADALLRIGSVTDDNVLSLRINSDSDAYQDDSLDRHFHLRIEVADLVNAWKGGLE